MVHLLTTTVCFITAVLSFHVAPPLNSKTNIHRTLTPRKPYSWNMSNLSLNPLSSPARTGKSLLDGNVQHNTPNVPFINEPTRVILSYLIKAGVGSPTDPLYANEDMAMKKRQSPGEL